MIDTIVTRRISNLNGKSYAKGDTIPMTLQQFKDLEPTGFVERAPPPAPEPKVAPAKKG